MRFIYALFIIFAVPQLWAKPRCDLFDSEQFANLTNLQIPNCISDDNIVGEIDARAESSRGPICGSCSEELSARIEVGAEDKKRLRKQAYLETMFSEYKKTMATLVSDMVAMRKLYSTGSNFNKSQQKCSADSFKKKIQSCSPFAKSFFENNNVDSLIPNEIASILSNQNFIPSLLKRPSQNQCSISDQEFISLKPLLLERIITPEIAQNLASLTAKNKEELLDKITIIEPDLIKQHPILASLLNDPTEFKSFFQSVVSGRPQSKFEDHFRNKLYTKANGDKIDNSTAQKCEQAINTLTSKVCSADFERGNISLGPIEGFERTNNDQQYPDAEAVTTEEMLSRNITLIEFCTPPTPGKLSLALDAAELNGWMQSGERLETFNSFTERKYNDLFKTPKSKVCSLLNNEACNGNLNSLPANVSATDCRLRNLYLESKRSGTLANQLSIAPDQGVNSVFRSLVGNPRDLSASTKEVLIAEGILPQANGQFVEREVPAERQPEYLAGVANGTITPNTGSSSTPVQANTNRQQRPQPGPSQQAVFQPQQGSTAIADQQQVAAATADDDSEALRNFQDGLEERRRRAEGSQTTAQNNRRDAQSNRRTASRQETSDRISDRSPTADFVPSPQPQAGGQVLNSVLPASTVGEASLGRDTSRRGLAERQRNAALAEMDGARSNPAATAEAGRGPASIDGQQAGGESTVALTISGDIRANLERVLNSSGSDGANLRSLIQNRRPFKFELNNSVFDVQFNNGNYSVSFRSGDNSRGPTLASTLQGVFNNSLQNTAGRSQSNDRNATLGDLQNTVRN